MRVAFIGSVEFSERLLQHVIAHPDAEVVGIATRASSSFNADFRSLEDVATAHGIPCLVLERHDPTELARWLQQRAPDVVYCFGWSYLLGPEILSIPPLGVIGYHPAALPQNRGRHPIIWALVLGLRSTASTFFFMDEGADSGDILSQVPVEIGPEDDARALYDRLQEVAVSQVSEFTSRLASGSYRRTPQDPARASSWRKRSKADGVIDWRMSSRSIHNLVRGLTRPYPGATFRLGDEEVTVWRVQRSDDAFPPGEPSNVEPGKVLEADASTFVVKCGEGAVRVTECDPFPDLQPGTYLK